MGIALDIFILVILVLSIFMGYKKGLISLIFSLCAFIIAIILTWILYTPITNFIIDNTDFDENIESAIIEKGINTSEEETKDNKNTIKNEDNINTYVEKYLEGSVEETKDKTIENTADIISKKVVSIVVAIVLFIVLRLVLILLKFVLQGLAELPLIKQLNKTGGVIYGIIRGLFIVYAVLAIMFFIISVNDSEVLTNMIDSSMIGKYLYTNNIILNVFFR